MGDGDRMSDFNEFNPDHSGEVRITSSTGGSKGSKPQRYDLVPVGPLRQLSELYGRGAEKYEDRNWERGYDWSLSYAAAQRHMNAFWGGEDIDPEMGIPHVICASFHMFAIAQFMDEHPEFDNRYRGHETVEESFRKALHIP